MGEEQVIGHAIKSAVDKKLFLWLIVLIVIWGLYVGLMQNYGLPITDKTQSSEIVTVLVKASDNGQIVLDKVIQVEKGSNAFEAMKKADPLLEFEEFSFGVMVNGINGVSPVENSFWALYINGEMAAVGISSVLVEGNMLIEWKTEEIEPYAS